MTTFDRQNEKSIAFIKGDLVMCTFHGKWQTHGLEQMACKGSELKNRQPNRDIINKNAFVN